MHLRQKVQTFSLLFFFVVCIPSNPGARAGAADIGGTDLFIDRSVLDLRHGRADLRASAEDPGLLPGHQKSRALQGMYAIH